MILFFAFCVLLGIIVGTVLYQIFPLESQPRMGGGGMVCSSEVQRVREEIELEAKKKKEQKQNEREGLS